MKVRELNKSIADCILSSEKMSFCLVGAVGTGKSEIMNIIYENLGSNAFWFNYDQFNKQTPKKYKEKILTHINLILNRKNKYKNFLIELEMLSNKDLEDIREKGLNKLIKQCRKLDCKIIISLYPEQEFEWYHENIKLKRII
ncbi:P-loop NTPase fold protein [Pasteurella oralis]|uniref:P-loop NTPase fold protein n=1 Tax=Pasteurella oralis TaxID=1071947 RepID=UPI000C7AB760|nr:P-loop NTPase fold protein [Pasteurella oralis]